MKENPRHQRTRIAKFSVQASKMRAVLDYLRAQKRIDSMEDLAQRLGIRRETLTNWAMGQVQIGQLVKYAFSYLFEIREEYWTAPADARLADYVGNLQPAPLTQDNEIRALIYSIYSLKEKAEAIERKTATLSQLTGL